MASPTCIRQSQAGPDLLRCCLAGHTRHGRGVAPPPEPPLETSLLPVFPQSTNTELSAARVVGLLPMVPSWGELSLLPGSPK